MPSLAHDDPASLATLAAAGDRELRPVLLLAQARAFARDGGASDRRRVASFEALALGLIPLVTDDVVADVAVILKDVQNIPDRVEALLRERRWLPVRPSAAECASSEHLALAELRDLVDLAQPAVDLALARNPSVTLAGRVLEALLQRAQGNQALARALLGRPEPTPLDGVSLYGMADEPTRARLREEIGRALAVSVAPRVLVARDTVDRMLGLAMASRFAPLRSMLGKALSISPAPKWRLREPAGAELFTLALVAAGLDFDECVRVLLTVDRTLASSATEVFRLAAICRTTTPAAAARLVGAGTAPARAAPVRRPTAPPGPAEIAAARTGRGNRARPCSATASADRSACRPRSAPAGRRSRSTTGPDRS